MDIEISGYRGQEALTDFPLLVRFGNHIRDFRYDSFELINGGDLRFTAPDGKMLLEHEVDQWDVGGVSLVWVKVPLIVGDFSRITAHWGNRLANRDRRASTTNDVWSSHYEFVYHFSDGLLDSTPHRRNAVAQNSPPSDKGLVGETLSFNPERRHSLHIKKDDFRGIGGGSPRTFSAWIYVEKVDNEVGNAIISWGANRERGERFEISLEPSGANRGSMHVEVNDGFTLAYRSLLDQSWHHIAIVCPSEDITKVQHYVDGELIPNETPSRTDIRTNIESKDCSDLLIGASIELNRSNARFYSGLLDEVRLESVARSAEWVKACYESQLPFTPFYRFGTIEGHIAVETEVESPKIYWESTLGKGLDLSGQNNKLVMVYIYRDDVKSCEDFEQNILTDPEVSRLLFQSYYCVKMELAKARENRTIKETDAKLWLMPTILLGKGAKDGNTFSVKDTIEGEVDRDNFLRRLKRADVIF
ncbi:DUF2341 domain-containing protein [Candidatus Sumerlaeota bacterium]|nr:DUF2341 domain-containing protein [Candidatus Sumerlaeota bacterium]